MIIAFEGIDGSGKTTASKLVANKIQQHGRAVELIHWYSFLQYYDEADAIAFSRAKKLKSLNELSPLANSLWHCADFAHRWDKQVKPSLSSGSVALFDRYYYSALVRDGIRGVSEAYVRSMYGFAQKPDLIFYFELPAEVALQRKQNDISYYEAGRDIFAFSNKSIEDAFLLFQTECQSLYKKFLPPEAVVIDATMKPEAICQIVIDKFLNSISNSLTSNRLF